MKKLLKIIFQDGSVISHDKVTDSYIECLEKIGLPTVHSLGISARDRSFINLVSEESDGINYTEVDGWFVFRKLGIEGMEKNLKTVSDRLNLNLLIEVVEKDEVFRDKDKKKTLRVFFEREDITQTSGAKTFAEAISKIGEEQVAKMGIIVAGHNLVARTGGDGYTLTSRGFYVWTKTPASQKVSLLEKISAVTNTKMKVSLV